MARIPGFVLLVICAAAIAAPVPPIPDARLLVACLSAPDEKARDEAVIALRNRSDAAPWLRRASRSTDRDTVRRAKALLAHFDGTRQGAVPRAIEACIRDGSADLFVEWHQFWKPKAQDDLWPVGPRMGRAALSEFAKRWPDEKTNHLEDAIASMRGLTCAYHDGPQPERFGSTLWHIRTERLRIGTDLITFASVIGPVDALLARCGYFFTLGRFGASSVSRAVVLCADGLFSTPSQAEKPGSLKISESFVVCRGNAMMLGSNIYGSVILVDGDVDLTGAPQLQNCTIRASGMIHLSKDFKPLAKDGKPTNCVIEAHVKNATEPYKFFALLDLGLSVADDEEGLVVTGVKPGTPFGDSGLTKGDLIKAIDDAPAGHSESFRASVRRALVRQGDCLLTVTRGDKSYDLPVFFPLPK